MKTTKDQFSYLLELIKYKQFDFQKKPLVKEILKNNKDGFIKLHKLSLELIHIKKFNEAYLILKELKKINKENLEIAYNLGLLSAILNDHQEAIYYFDELINKNKNDLGALINKSASLIDLGKIDLAIKNLDYVLSINKEIPQAWINKGIALSKINLHKFSADAYSKALEFDPSNHEIWLNRSIALGKNLQFGEALKCCDEALKIKPDYVNAWLSRSYMLNELKHYLEALESCDKALSLKPDFAEAWSNRSYTLNELKRHSEALESCDKALSLKPDFAEAWYNRGVSLCEMENYELADQSFDKAICHNKDYAEAWYNKGALSTKNKRYREAINFYENAIEIQPNYVDAILNQGLCYGEIKEYEKAICCYRKVIELNPNSAEAWNNSGAILTDLKNYDRALQSFELAYRLKPNLEWLLGQLIHTKMIMCDWGELDEKILLLESEIRNGSKAIVPFPALAIFDSPQLLEKVAHIYVEEKFIKKTKEIFNINTKKDKKIKVGYYSADFGNHPISYLIPELLELHNRDHFEIHGFSFGNHKDSPFLERIKSAFDYFYDLSHENDHQIVKLSRKLDIDIAIDLMGHTKDSRMEIFSSRAAPIQISYLGYLGTTGSKFIDYLVADKTIITNELKNFYSEKLIFLPSYQANDRKKIVANKKFYKSELGLSENSFVFCCLNNTYKILPVIFDSWMKILKAQENSVLYLYAENKWAAENLKREAKLRGVSDSRILFAEAIPYNEYLARYKICDLFLDTFPYNAGTTASDALWTGLPVLTLKGQSFSSRMASSLLTSVGIPELITNSLLEYESLAVDLSGNPPRLTQIKEKLIRNIDAEPLFDSLKFVKNYERALLTAYHRNLDGFDPDDIDVS